MSATPFNPEVWTSPEVARHIEEFSGTEPWPNVPARGGIIVTLHDEPIPGAPRVVIELDPPADNDPFARLHLRREGQVDRTIDVEAPVSPIVDGLVPAIRHQTHEALVRMAFDRSLLCWSIVEDLFDVFGGATVSPWTASDPRVLFESMQRPLGERWDSAVVWIHGGADARLRDVDTWSTVVEQLVRPGGRVSVGAVNGVVDATRVLILGGRRRRRALQPCMAQPAGNDEASKKPLSAVLPTLHWLLTHREDRSWAGTLTRAHVDEILDHFGIVEAPRSRLRRLQRIMEETGQHNSPGHRLSTALLELSNLVSDGSAGCRLPMRTRSGATTGGLEGQ